MSNRSKRGRGRGRNRNENRGGRKGNKQEELEIPEPENVTTQNTKPLTNKRIAFAGFSDADTERLTSFVQAYNGHVVAVVDRQTTFVVATTDGQKANNNKIKRAKQHAVPVVNIFYLYDAVYTIPYPEAKKYPLLNQDYVILLDPLMLYNVDRKELHTKFLETFPEIESTPYNSELITLWSQDPSLKLIPALKSTSEPLNQVIQLEENEEESVKLFPLLRNGFSSPVLGSKLLVLETLITFLEHNFIQIDELLLKHNFIIDIVQLFFETKSNVLQCAIASILAIIYQFHHFSLQNGIILNMDLISAIKNNFDSPLMKPHLRLVANIFNHVTSGGHASLGNILAEKNWDDFCEKKLKIANRDFSSFDGEFKPPPRPIKTENSVLQDFSPEEIKQFFGKIEPTPQIENVNLKCGNFDKCGKTETEIKFSRCSRCKKVAYCSLDCQKAHWGNIHKKECKSA